MMLSRQVVEGLILLGFMLLALGVLVIGALRARAKMLPMTDGDKTLYWQPHRTAEFKLTAEFLAMLASLEQTLQSTAMEEGWSIDWNEHKKAYEQASKALSEKAYAAALLPLGKAIHVLMSSIQEARRRLDYAQKWGWKTPVPPSRKSGEKSDLTPPPQNKEPKPQSQKNGTTEK
jgi:hypothetical protein